LKPKGISSVLSSPSSGADFRPLDTFATAGLVVIVTTAGRTCSAAAWKALDMALACCRALSIAVLSTGVRSLALPPAGGDIEYQAVDDPGRAFFA